MTSTRESRIRALAEAYMPQVRLREGHLRHLDSEDFARRALAMATADIDAIDALPVPPRCITCGDIGAIMGEHQTEELDCPDCNGTGKADR